jgi:hypothetical protein
MVFFFSVLSLFFIEKNVSQEAAQAARKLAKRDKKTLLPTIRLEELAKRPDWISVRGVVVDVARFASVHPGGEQIRAFGGTDCSAAFASMHGLRSDEHWRRLAESEFAVAQLDARAGGHIDPECDSAFARDVLQSVATALKGVSPYAPYQWWLRTAIIAAATLGAEWYWATQATWWAMVAVGVLHAMIGVCVQHDGSHGAVSANPTINTLVSYGADWIGNSRWLWFQQHVIGHHPHCNVEGADPDAHSAEPFLFFHWTPRTVRQVSTV